MKWLLRNTLISEEDAKKRPSDLEIAQKDLPPNQPTLGERGQRDRRHMFHQMDEKHGYWTNKPVPITERVKSQLKSNPKKAVLDSFKVLKVEVEKWKEEVKRGDYNMSKNIAEELVQPGQRRKEWGFQSELDMAEWIVTKDADWGEGYSSAEFHLNNAGTGGVFSGNLSTRVPQDGRTMTSGYANIASMTRRKSFARMKIMEHWQNYTHLTMNVRGDGRKYMINLKVKRDYDMIWDDRWHYPLFTRGGPYWQYVKIPFSKFYLGHKGYIQDKQEPVPLFFMKSISITLKDKITGPFQLEIKDISLHNDPTGDDEIFAYEMYKTPDFYAGS